MPRATDNAAKKPAPGELAKAILRHDEAEIEGLLQRGADPDEESSPGYSVLSWASLAGRMGIMRLLIEYGAEVNKKDYYGRTPLMEAARAGGVEAAQLLIDHGAEVNAVDEDGWTALMRSALYQNMAVMRLLLDNGAEVGIQADGGDNAINLAECMGETEMVHLLKETLVSQQEAKQALAIYQKHSVAVRNQQKMKVLKRKPVTIRRLHP